MSAARPWLIYGANGYTGELIAREAVKRRMRPILAGRHRQKIETLAAELKCPSAVFDLQDQTALLSTLENVAAVLNCAGPFSRTARSMMQACLASHVHYLDITGEIEVFELAHSVHDKAQRAGIVLCPGVGFDVVPTDCLALKLKQAMPDATHLYLGFDSHSGLSKGTAKTTVETLGQGARIRRNGEIVRTPLGSQTRRIDFGAGERMAVGITWGDVSTAYYSTGICNIEVFIASSSKTVRRMRRANLVRPLLRQAWLQTLLKFAIEKNVRPPDRAQRDNNPTFVWGEVKNAAGCTLSGRLRTPNGYALTVYSSIGMMEEVLTNTHPAGFATPGMLVGPDFVSTLPGSSEIRIDQWTTP